MARGAFRGVGIRAISALLFPCAALAAGDAGTRDACGVPERGLSFGLRAGHLLGPAGTTRALAFSSGTVDVLVEDVLPLE